MFKALMGGGRSASTSSSSKSGHRKADSKSSTSRKSSRGDDRDRGLGDLSAYTPSASGSKRGPPSAAGDSVASTYVTAEPDVIDYPDRTIVERTPKRRDSDRESKSSRRRERDRSESRERERRKSSRRSADDGLDDDLDGEHDRRERRRTHSGDPYVPPISTAMPSSAPGAQFAADIAAPGFSQFPMQYDTAMPTVASFPPGQSPGHDTSPAPFDPHVQQQFPGQFPLGTAAPYFPPNNPAGAAADYYGDQGQSVSEQPGIRPHQPAIIPNSQAHLMAASSSANPPPEPSSLGQVGAAAAYFGDEIEHTASQTIQPLSGSSSLPLKPSKPGKPGKPSKPSKPYSSPASAIPLAAAAAGAVTYGVGSTEESHSSSAAYHQSASYSQPAMMSSSKPPHSHGIGAGVGMAAAGAAAGYMMGHQHHSSSPTHSSQYTFQNYEQSSQASVPPYTPGTNNAILAAGAAGAAGYAAHAAHNPGFYPHGGLAVQHRHRGPLSKFVDFWRDPEGVGRFEDYTETIGVCKYCFEPGTSSVDAPRKHYYHGRRHSADRYSSGGSSRINKLSRYQSSEDESRRRKRSSKKSSSWLPGMLAGYAAKSIFAGKDFDDSYSVRSGHVSGDRLSSYTREEDRRSYTSRGVVRRSGRSPPREHHSDRKPSRRTRSRSRSSSQSGRHSFVQEAALGAAVGSAALAVSKSHQRPRSRSPSRAQRRKDSSSSASFVDVSQPSAKSVGGFTSFFTSTSENRKKEKTRSKKSRSFFSFNSSSSSSLDADLAFGTGFAKKSSKLQKKKKGKKHEDVDAALIGLGATATALAAASDHRHSRSTGQIMTARETRHSNYTSSATNEDDEWVDAESEDQSSASVSSALAFGASSADSGTDSNSSGGWKWGWGNKKKKKDKKSSKMDVAMAVGAGALGGAAIASVARRRDSRPPSEAGSLQQVYPVPTSDPSRFDVSKMSPSVMSGDQPPLVRPGPIPLQQPQPYAPVSQAVYTTQGNLPGSIPAYSAPAVPPIFANEYDQYNPQFQGARDAAYAHQIDSVAGRRKHHRSDSTPVFPTQENSTSTPKRRSTFKDQASVSFDLTEEQAERERNLARRVKKPRDDSRDDSVQLIDHEAELAREEAERRERRERRKYRDEDNRRSDSDKEKDSSWVEEAAVGAIGAAAASSLISSSKKDGDKDSEVSSRHRDRRAERRAERRGEPSVISKSTASEPTVDQASSSPSADPDKRSTRRSPRPALVHEDYAEFFAPAELRHSPDQHAGDQDRSRDSAGPEVVEVVPASERGKNNDMPRDDLPQFAQEPYEDRDHLPWPVPRLNFIDPTPPQSINGSMRGTPTPSAPVELTHEEEASKQRELENENEHERDLENEPQPEPERERISTGSRVSWGPHETHEYEIPSSSEQDPHSPIEEAARDLSMKQSEKEPPKDLSHMGSFGHDIEFAATIAAATEAAGFDPSFVFNDPTYHTRTSPPGSEDEGTFSPLSKWAAAPQPEQPHGFVEGEVESYEPSKSRDIEPSAEPVIEEKLFYAEPESFTENKDVSFSQRPDRGSIAQEVIEQLNGKSARKSSPDNDVFSMPGGFDSGDKTRDGSRDDTRSVFSAPPERESEKSKSKKSRHSGNDYEFSREILERERETAPSPPLEDVEETVEDKKRRKHRSKHGDSDTFSVDDDARSAIASTEDVEKSERRKHRHRSSRDKDFDDTASIASSPAAASYEDGEKSERRKRRSKHDSDPFSVDDDARSAITSLEDVEKSERRKHRHRSSRDKDFDDTASITSSPARIDESREKRRSRDSKDEKEKDKSGSILRSIFGSRVSAPEGRTRSNHSSRSSSLEKRPSRDAMSEAGVDEETRRRKKRSSRHRSSSGGEKLDDYGSDKEAGFRDDTNLEEYRLQRQQKEERRRHRYEEIVESGKRRESEKV
ncbi:uncharacterized protein N7482_010305 [Penicillium canariense]|uniref:Involucrin repeat protein n=1 Tax=Penicillium canariense TaxID=189055 RepID=A0A9W9HJJ3_9EURO|nr:uncharacterized protein N7482_010305 [Penicillium canariense]KAJ5151053.1 hypothetical protein N7482_010305 [Penicillium canariense]